MSNKETKTDLPKETFCIERYDGKSQQGFQMPFMISKMSNLRSGTSGTSAC